MNTRGIFFSADALIALAIIMIVILVAFPIFEYSIAKENVHQDSIIILSSLKIGEFASNSNTVNTWIALGIINDTEKLLIEQLGIFSAENPAYAQALAQEILNMINTTENIGIWYDDQYLASKNTTSYESAEKVDVARQTISGIGGLGEGSATGFSARAYLSGSSQSVYTYFGGYVGEGNVTFLIKYNGTIIGAEMELVANKNFDLYVNGVKVGNYSKSPSESEPVTYVLPITNFSSGDNTLEFRGDGLHIAGGFVKLNYLNENVFYQEPTRYYFPGINGLINIYDGFYIPGNLTNMSVALHMNSSYVTFLILGNTTVYNGSTNGEQTVIINNSWLLSALNYSSLSKKTIPLRLGLENVSYIYNFTTRAEVLSVTDLSGSMGGQKITNAKAANIQLIDVILNYSGNKVALAGYEDFSKKADFHNLSNSSTSLKNIVNNVWNADGNTCICCGIIKALSCYTANVFIDNFNGQNNGSNPIGWTLDESTGYIDITTRSLEGNRGVILSRDNGEISMEHIFAAEQEALSLAFNFSHLSGAGIFRLEVGSSNGDASGYDGYMQLRMYNNRIQNNAGGVWTDVVPYNLNRNYTIRMNIVPGSSTYTLYVNNTAYTNLPVLVTRNNVAKMEFFVHNADANYLVDNIKVSLNQTLCPDANQNFSRSMIVMSDGVANKICGLDPVVDYDSDGDTSNDADDHAIEAACDAKQLYNITVHAVLFGTGGNEEVMQQIAQCGGGNYYYSDVGDLITIYNQIANNIIQATYAEQTLGSAANVTTRLYPDSYIEFDYLKEQDEGLIITLEKRFDNNYSGNFSIPANSSIIETKVISYSGPKWTDKVFVNNNKIYGLGDYGNDYTKLGDPYFVNIPNSYVLGNNANNTINLTVGVSPINSTYGSIFNKIIYTISRNFLAYSDVLPDFEGCSWELQFEDFTNLTLDVPSTYSGSEICTYTNFSVGDDAAQAAAYNLFSSLDFDSDGKIDYKFTSNDLQIELNNLVGIPFVQSHDIQVRIWR